MWRIDPDSAPGTVRSGGPVREVPANAYPTARSHRGNGNVMSMSASMHRIKVVNDVSDLVSILRAVDSPLKLKLVQRLGENWLTGEDVEREFGKEGIKALVFFEKLRLIDTRWVAREGRKQPDKSYHFYYSTININTTSPLAEVSEILAIAMMSPKEYAKLEQKIHDAVGVEGRFFSDVAEELGMSPTRLKGLVKRSDKLEYRGHRIERFQAETTP
jgi:predicted DNA-binding ArsR family transcriptional regulator